MRDIVVLGGGISGLSLAYFLRQALRTQGRHAATRIRVVEASERSGGWIHTAQQRGFLFEEGPRGFRPSRNGAEMLRLVEQLALQDKMRAVDAAARARYVLRDGVVEKLPSSLSEVLSWSLTPAVIKAGINELFTAPTQLDDESVHAFISRRFSPVVADRLLDPVASGIFGGDIRHLSMRSCFQLLWDLEQSHGSVVRGMLFSGSSGDDRLLDGSVKSEFIRQHEGAVSVSFQDGMGTLVRALEAEIQKDEHSELVTNTKALEIQPDNSAHHSLSVTTQSESGGDGAQATIQASRVISTIPAYQLAPVVSRTIPTLAESLRTIDFVSMATVHVGFEDHVLPSDGFGYLVPSCENEDVLGVVFDSNSFPCQNASSSPQQTRLSVMCGGAHCREIESLPLAEIEERALTALRRHLGVHEPPSFVRSVVLRQCIPQYHVGFHQTRATIESRLAPGMHLAGNSFYGIGLADCVTRSRQLALELAAEIDQQSPA